MRLARYLAFGAVILLSFAVSCSAAGLLPFPLALGGATGGFLLGWAATAFRSGRRNRRRS